MLNFRELTLNDKPDFDRILAKMQLDVSDYTFTNFFMWRHTYELTVAYDEESHFWFLLARPKRWKPFFFAPLGDWQDTEKLKSALDRLNDYCDHQKLHLFFRRVPEIFHKRVKEIQADLDFREDRNTYDYVYSTKELIELSGRKYHAKRNHLNQFMRGYKWGFQPIDEATLNECLALKTEWFDLETTEKEQIISGEAQAMLEVLHNYSALNLTGAVIRIDGRIQALTMGELLNREMAVIHIEKANTEFKGIYAAINQQFLTHYWAHVPTVNREEDMGIDGLRKAKLSYNPVSLVEKYNLYK